jgi:beta-lactam-binding protein with PASTA domain
MRKLIKFSLYFFVFILLGLMFGYLTFKTLSFSRTVEMPNLYGKSLLESNKLLTSKDLYLKIEGEDYDSTVPPGVVIRQDVPAGKKVKERRAIKVVISKGPRVKSVPEVVNKTLADAESLLLQKGLKVREIMVHSDTVEKDKIVAQKPGPDEQASDTVTVLVSLGPYDKFYYCPDFRGMSAEQANDLIKKLGMKISIEGTGEKVETQRPDPGRQIKSGDTIYLKLS